MEKYKITKKKPSEIETQSLEEARKRREKTTANSLPTELGGRDGPEPTRFGDWEKKGIISDF
tara:strand:- start:140 stop:325 length:186 start_codon:yes stop_codon:yes gene_type:complete